MAAMTSVLVVKAKEGKGDAARDELQELRSNAESLGATTYLSWVVAGTAPPGSLALFIIFPDAEAYAKAISGDKVSEFRMSLARGETALDVISTSLLQEVAAPAS